MPEIVIPYTPNPVQRRIHELAARVRFPVVAAHRSAGKSLAAVSECLDTALFSSHEGPRAAYVGPFRNQTKLIAWDYAKRLAGVIPGMEPNETELRIDFPHNNGRLFLAGADGCDHLRGVHLDMLVLDEPAFQPPNVWPEILRPTLSARQGRALFVGTFLSRQNHFWHTYDKAGSLPEWGRLLVKASQSGILSAAELASARATMSPEQYAREYELVCSAVLDGSVYGKLLDEMERQGRLGVAPWSSRTGVWTAWDIGVSDSTAIWFLQRDGRGWRAIDYEEHAGAGLAFYARLLQGKPYTYAGHIGPHDLSVQEFGSGKTRVDVARELGIRFTLAPRLALEEGIEAVRNLLPELWIDRAHCGRGVDALQDYRFTWDEHLRIFSRKPFHNWSSHACDALRIFATGYRERSEHRGKLPTHNTMKADPLGLFFGGKRDATTPGKWDPFQ
ncbi:MAG: hypothetical protein ACHQ7N_08380 [Candidatus Methylomirabilales bacterium]